MTRNDDLEGGLPLHPIALPGSIGVDTALFIYFIETASPWSSILRPLFRAAFITNLRPLPRLAELPILQPTDYLPSDVKPT